MTQKELLYLEDAIMHEDNIIKVCDESLKSLDDEKLINYLNNEIKKHSDLRKNLMNFLEVNANE